VVSGHPPNREGICLIRVEDNGIGFDIKEAGSIFEPLKRLSSSASIEGTGLGLATTKKIVDQHNGEIRVESKPDGGTTFTILLPTHQHLNLQQAENQIRDIVDKDAI
jgi:signal transduction histidine kinase